MIGTEQRGVRLVAATLLLLVVNYLNTWPFRVDLFGAYAFLKAGARDESWITAQDELKEVGQTARGSDFKRIIV